MIKETNLAKANSYYRVLAPFPCVIQVGCAESRTYVGASMMLMKVYSRMEAQPGDEVHNLYGGLFLCRADEQRAYPVEIAPFGQHPFLKQYLPPYEQWPLDQLQALSPQEAHRFERHDTLHTIHPDTMRAQGWFASW